jgi:outer membrane protein assembly factor BamB
MLPCGAERATSLRIHSTHYDSRAFGGANWGGMATDQKFGYVFVYTHDQAQIGWMEKRKPGFRPSFEEVGTKLPYGRGTADGLGSFQTFSADADMGMDGKPLGALPCQKPPWGRLSAVNANTGEIMWRTTLGVTDGLPEGKQNTGRAGGLAGPTATAGGLVFIGATSDNRFRAFDSKTGKQLWEAKLPATATANPVTYQGKNGSSMWRSSRAGRCMLMLCREDPLEKYWRLRSTPQGSQLSGFFPSSRPSNAGVK